MSDRHIILVGAVEGNTGGVVCGSYDKAFETRETLESKGVETFGIIRVLTVSQALVEGK